MTPLEVRSDGVTAGVLLPDDEPIGALDPAPTWPDVSRLPGASMVGVASGEQGATRVVLGCMRAPSGRWVPGLQSVVFERATPMILGAASIDATLGRGPSLAAAGASFSEMHRGKDGERDVVVAHALAFVGADADAVACSLACSEPSREPRSEPSSEPSGAARCDGIAGTLALTGELRPEPPPGLVASAILGASEHPAIAVAIGSALSVGVVALLLLTRPRLRPTSRGRRRAS